MSESTVKTTFVAGESVQGVTNALNDYYAQYPGHKIISVSVVHVGDHQWVGFITYKMEVTADA